MAVIQTVLGPVSPNDLGVTMMHEHVVAHFNERLKALEFDYAIRELKKARMWGCRTIEVGPPRMFLQANGRGNIPVLQEVARRAGVDMLCCTGYYQIHPEIKDKGTEAIADEMVTEIIDGIDGTTVRAGLIKVSANHVPLEPSEEKIFTAAAKAQSQTGVPICCHSIPMLEEAGLDRKTIDVFLIENPREILTPFKP